MTTTFERLSQGEHADELRRRRAAIVAKLREALALAEGDGPATNVLNDVIRFLEGRDGPPRCDENP